MIPDQICFILDLIANLKVRYGPMYFEIYVTYSEN